MDGTKYAVMAYVVGLGLLLGYAVALWIEGRMLKRRQERAE